MTSAQSYFEENKPRAGLGRQSLHNGVAYVVARGANMFVQLGSTILLARLLSPRDYGLVAMVLALVGFAPMLIDLGTTDATVQKKKINQVDISALFWLKVTLASILVLLLVGASGTIASFYGEPALGDIAMVSSLLFITSALSSQHFALMRRSMQFRRMAMIDVSANVISSLIAIAMALTGWGYWALVTKPIFTSALAAAGAWFSCPWLPGRPRLTLQAKEMVRFGAGITGFSMTDYLAQSADRVALGYFFGASPLGYFQNTVLLYNHILSLFTQGLHDVAVSSLCKLRDNIDQLKRSWTTALSSLTFFSAFAFAGLAVTGQDFVTMLLGQKWEPAGPLVCIFAVRGIVHVVERSLGWLHVAAGRSDRLMRWGVFSALIQLGAVLAGIPFGVIGVAIAHTIATFFLVVPALVYAGRPLEISVTDVLRAVAPQVIAALLTVAIASTIQYLFLAKYSLLPRFLVSVIVCCVIYFVIAVGVFKVRHPLHIAFSLLRDLRPLRWAEDKSGQRTGGK
jgi:PST family polysaccharide transporter